MDYAGSLLIVSGFGVMLWAVYTTRRANRISPQEMVYRDFVSRQAHKRVITGWLLMAGGAAVIWL
jgi:hypothetical protein